MIKKALGLFIVLVLSLVLFREAVLGFFVQSLLTEKLTRLFGMPVFIHGMRIEPFSGKVQATRVTFMNQPEFSNRPHLDVQGLEFDIRMASLLKKKVEIGTVALNHPFYLFERISTPEGLRNNIKTWYRHMEGPDEEDDGPSGSSGWQVKINKIVFRDGTFVYHDLSDEQSEKKLVFKSFNASLSDFQWPAPDPAALVEKVRVQGFFGEQTNAPFWIYGNANFATSQVNFDLTGQIEDGSLAEQQSFFEGLPLEINGGIFSLKIAATCNKKQFSSNSLLKLKSVKVTPGPKATDKIWGYPMTMAVGFMENQKTINLKVPVHGHISDPKFEFLKAFRDAFQASLRHRVTTGIRLFVAGTTRIATQTGQALVETPVKIAEGLEKVATMVKMENLVKFPESAVDTLRGNPTPKNEAPKNGGAQ